MDDKVVLRAAGLCLEMRRVSRTYGQGASQVHALYEVDLTVQAGEMVAVMGPSGRVSRRRRPAAGCWPAATPPPSPASLWSNPPETAQGGAASYRFR